MTSQITDVTIQGTKTEEFEDQGMKVLTSQVDTKKGVRKAQNLFAVGFASAPVDGDRLIVKEIESALYAIGGSTRDVEETLGLKGGERCIFSTDADGNILQKLFFKTNGTMVLDDGSDSGVRYSALETAFNQLQADFDAHVHPATGILDSIGNACTGATSAILVGSTADISDAKISTFKVQTKAEQDA